MTKNQKNEIESVDNSQNVEMESNGMDNKDESVENSQNKVIRVHEFKKHKVEGISYHIEANYFVEEIFFNNWVVGCNLIGVNFRLESHGGNFSKDDIKQIKALKYIKFTQISDNHLIWDSGLDFLGRVEFKLVDIGEELKWKVEASSEKPFKWEGHFVEIIRDEGGILVCNGEAFLSIHGYTE